MANDTTEQSQAPFEGLFCTRRLFHVREDDHCNVIALLVSGDVGPHILEDEFPELGGRQVHGSQPLFEPRDAIVFVLGVHGLADTVAVEHHGIAGIEADLGNTVGGVFQDSARQTGCL